VLDWYNEGGDKGESSWLAWVFLGQLPKSVRVLHTVRDPWQVADSLARRNDIIPNEAGGGKKAYRDAIAAYCPEVEEYETAIDRAAALVIYWNRRIEAAAPFYGCPYRRYQVEDLTAKHVRDLLAWLNIYRDGIEIDRALTETPRNVNGGKRIEYDIEVKNPLVRAYLQEVYPGREPVINRAFSVDTKRTTEEIERDMNPTLRAQLIQLAARYGYERTTEPQTIKGDDNGALKQCALV
jgi:hypothetical protein